MRSLTRNIGKSIYIPNLDADNGNIRRVLIIRPNNRLGNLLLITPLVQEISSLFPNVKIDLFTRGTLAQVIFQNYDNVARVIELPKKPFKHLINYAAGWLSLRKYRYDLVVNVVRNSSSGRLSTQFTRSRFKIFGDVDEGMAVQYQDSAHVAKYPVYNLHKYLTLAGYDVTSTAIPTLDLKLTGNEIKRGEDLLLELTHNYKRTICLFTYATGNKRYSKEWWEAFYSILKEDFPDDNIIEVLPAENVSQLSFKIPSFYSTDIRELGALIANTDVFIGADSGIMHLASAVQTPTVGLFSVTDPHTFGPYGSGSVFIDTNKVPHKAISDAVRSILETEGITPTYRTRTRSCIERKQTEQNHCAGS